MDGLTMLSNTLSLTGMSSALAPAGVSEQTSSQGLMSDGRQCINCFKA